MGGMGLKSGPGESLLLMEAKTEMALLAGCSQTGHSAPVALMGCSLSNLLLQVGQKYS